MATSHESLELAQHHFFDGEYYKFTSAEVLPFIDQTPVRSVFYVRNSAIQIDREGRMYIDTDYEAYTAEDAFDYLSQIDDDQEREESMSRVIKVHDGYIVDDSHLCITHPDLIKDRYARMPTSVSNFGPECEYKPVLKWAGHPEEWDIIQEKLALEYNFVIQEPNALEMVYVGSPEELEED